MVCRKHPPRRATRFMVWAMDVKKVFDNTDAKRVVQDYTQFDTRILSSTRSGGKTYIVQEDVADRFLKKGKYFAYIRESQVEIDNALLSGFWDSHLIAQPKYKGHTFGVRGNRIYIDGVVVGVAYALTTYCNIRGTQGGVGGAVSEKIKKAREKELKEQIDAVQEFSEQAEIDQLDTIFFDEFEPLAPKMTSAARFEAYLHSADTLFRFRHHVKAVWCGNLENCFSPFLYNMGFGDLKKLEYGIKKSYTKQPNRKGKIEPLAVWCHIKPNEEWKDARDASYVGKIIRGNPTASAMFGTGDAYKGFNFKKIDGKPLQRCIVYNLTDGVNALTYWKTREGIWYLTDRTSNISFPTFALNLKQAGDGVRLLPDSYRRQLLTTFEAGQIQFDDARSFEIFINMIPNTRSVKNL